MQKLNKHLRRDRPLAGMDPDVYYELVHRCYRYNSWKAEIACINASLTPSSVAYDGMPHAAHNTDSRTEKKAVRLATLQGWVDEIDEAARRTSREFAPYIIRYCVNRDVSFLMLQNNYGIPCSQATFFRYRSLFFYHLLFIREVKGM